MMRHDNNDKKQTHGNGELWHSQWMKQQLN